jgi:hypothetical protein
MTQADSVLSTPPTNTSRSRRTVLAGIASAAALPIAALPIAAAAPAAAARTCDAELIEFVARFERLLDEYYARRSAWGPRLAQAHAETDELFGETVNEDDAEDREKFFSKACARLNVHEAHDRMHAVGEEMKPLARTITALPTTSLEVLQAKALVAFWEVAPLCAGDTTYYFGDEYPFQLLFSAVAEFCGLTHKVTATGYTLPELTDLFSPCGEDDEEEA